MPLCIYLNRNFFHKMFKGKSEEYSSHEMHQKSQLPDVTHKKYPFPEMPKKGKKSERTGTDENSTGIADKENIQELGSENRGFVKFLSQLEPGDYVVIVGTYSKEKLARKEVERIKSRYPELFIPYLSSELHGQYCNDYGEGSYFDGIYWRTYIGEFYSKNSANLLKEKAIRELEIPDDAFIRSVLTGDSEYTRTNDKDEKTGWVFIGAYDKNHNKIFGNIEGYPKEKSEYEFIRKDRVYNIREAPPKTVGTYYKDLRKIDVVGSIRAGNRFFIKKIKKFLIDKDTIKIWAKIEKKAY